MKTHDWVQSLVGA